MLPGIAESPLIISPVLIPTVESTVTVVTPDATSAVTVLTLVTSPIPTEVFPLIITPVVVLVITNLDSLVITIVLAKIVLLQKEHGHIFQTLQTITV